MGLSRFFGSGKGAEGRGVFSMDIAVPKWQRGYLSDNMPLHVVLIHNGVCVPRIPRGFFCYCKTVLHPCVSRIAEESWPFKAARAVWLVGRPCHRVWITDDCFRDEDDWLFGVNGYTIKPSEYP
jgi:hypothetical protein